MNQVALYNVKGDTYTDAIPRDSGSKASSTSILNKHHVTANI